ncbi:HEAT repeat domain-containing protein [Brasilonema bromeliae]|uniref:NACHT domain-containing protein n=1 Tax=Brasilonema bromeliae SPC951 TaxID=385972 RepID=A0ABX1P9E5_9CYAN|nr:HEAT repeat domain-containing protein [Brasilonema bromeliae]NMG21057.1 hypothetical protein [Brasilonema bromeliae SPC951]
MAQVSGKIIQELLLILRPFMRDKQQRQAYLELALGTNSPVLNLLVWDTSADVFIPQMVNTLVVFGEITPGKPALCALLEVVRGNVGLDKQLEIDNLLQGIREELQRSPTNSSRVSPLFPHPEFQTYLENIAQKYQQWSNMYTLTDAEGKVFDVGLMVQTRQPKQREGMPGEVKQETERLPVLEAIRKYAINHVLLIGKPGSGKSTALQRLLWEEAQAAIQGEKRKIPVLVELRYWDTSVETLICKFLRKHKHRIDISKIEDLLIDEELLLLMDGLNELPSDEARDKVARFRQDYPETPMIFTTRDLGVGGSLGIDKQLEMQPLTEAQMQEFVRKYLPEQGEQMLQQLGNRLRELGETPLILKMLCDVFFQKREIPKSRGDLFRQFDSTVNNLKEEKETVPVAEGLRLWKKDLLQHLAFVMMQPENLQANPTDFRLLISRRQAETILEDFLKGRVEYPAQKAKDWLEGLLKHCLVESKASESEQVLIQFHHQLFQEYYAAEYFLRLLPNLSDAKLKRDYLNYLKWTESIAIALALVEDEALAVQVVRLALDVDLMLGARLAGEVKEEFHEKTVGLVLELGVHQRLKIELLGMTRSEQARSPLQQARDNRDYDNVYSLAEALSCVGDEQLMSQLLEWEDKHIAEWNQAKFYEDYNNHFLCERIASELENIESSDVVVLNLVKLLNDKKLINKKGSDEYLKPRNYQAQAVLGEGLFNQAISFLLKSLKHEDFRVRYHAALALGNIGSDAEACALFKIVEDENYFVRSGAVEALGRFRSYTVITPLIKALNDEKAFVRSRSAEALGKFRDYKVINALIQALKDEKFFVRSNVVKALGKMDYKQVLEHLIKALNDENSDVRQSAVIALGELAEVNHNNQLITDALNYALNDEESSISSSATDVLKSIKKNRLIKLEKIKKNRLIDSVLDKESLVYSYPVQVEEIVVSKFLPQMQELLLVAIYEMKDLILQIQEIYKFYNHEIFHSPPIEETKSTSTSSTTIINSEIVQIIEKNEGDVIGKKTTET